MQGTHLAVNKAVPILCFNGNKNAKKKTENEGVVTTEAYRNRKYLPEKQGKTTN